MRSAISISVLVAGFTGFVACGGADVSRELGARCDRPADCADRCLGPSGDYPDGFCTVDCTRSEDCPSDGACVDEDGGFCLFRCEVPSDCDFLGPDWTCKALTLRADPTREVLVCRGP